MIRAEKMAKTVNGIDLATFEGISQRFFKGTGRHDPSDNPSFHREDVRYLTSGAKNAMLEYQSGECDSAVDLFAQVMRDRSALLSDPTIKADHQAHEYVKGMIAISDDGNPEESLKLTIELYGNALDPSYKGEPEEPEPKTSNELII